LRIPELFSSTRSIRSPGVSQAMVRMYLEKAYSATFFRSSRARPLIVVTGWSERTTFSSLRPAHFTSLTVEDFKRILTEPRNALIKQYQAMMETEGVTIEFTQDAIDAIANFAAQVNQQTENIGARRLQTIMEKLLEEISFEGPDLDPKHQRIDAAYVSGMLAETVKDQDLSRYIL
jgi:hypothetical protein